MKPPHLDNLGKYRHWNDVDIFLHLGITDEDGNQLVEANLNPLMGYQIIHKQTGRLLPQCSRNEIMGASYATKRFIEVILFYEAKELENDFEDYIFSPMYLTDLDIMSNGFRILYDDEDVINMK